jgi:hypothetical protein
VGDEASVSFRFSKREVAVEKIEAEIRSVLSRLADPRSDVARSATAAGLEPTSLAKARATVTEEAKGFAPVAVVVVIFTPVAAHIVDKFWDDVIWPRVKGRLGADALGKREQ